jgi:hypothetical protein
MKNTAIPHNMLTSLEQKKTKDYKEAWPACAGCAHGQDVNCNDHGNAETTKKIQQKFLVTYIKG